METSDVSVIPLGIPAFEILLCSEEVKTCSFLFNHCGKTRPVYILHVTVLVTHIVRVLAYGFHKNHLLPVMTFITHFPSSSCICCKAHKTVDTNVHVKASGQS